MYDKYESQSYEGVDIMNIKKISWKNRIAAFMAKEISFDKFEKVLCKFFEFLNVVLFLVFLAGLGYMYGGHLDDQRKADQGISEQSMQ